MANNGKQCLTIQEISTITGKAQNTIYRYIREGKLKGYKVVNSGKQCLTVSIEDIERFFQIKVESNGKQRQTMANSVNDDVKQWQTAANNGKHVLTTDNFKTLMDEYFEEKQSQLMKPLEQQAIYQAGELNKENQFLKARLETVIEENRELREAMKALPGPPSEVSAKLEKQQAAIATLQEEKQSIQKEATQAAHLLQERDEALQEKETVIQTIQSEKEKELEAMQKRTEELQRAKEEEMAALQEKLEAEEKEKLELVEVWKKELDAERNKPWWKKLLGR